MYHAFHYGMSFDYVCWDCNPEDHPFTPIAPGVCRYCCFPAKMHYENFDRAMQALLKLEEDLRD